MKLQECMAWCSCHLGGVTIRREMVLGQEQGSVLQGFLQAAGGVGVERSVPPPSRHCSVAFGGLSNCCSEGGILGSRQAPLLLAVDTRGVCLRFGRLKALPQGPPPVTRGRACTSIVLSLLLALDSRAVVTKYHRLGLKQRKPLSSDLEVRSPTSGC